MNLEVKNIYKRYIAKYIIKDFSYSFKSGGTYGISGPNGSGKSTLIQILSGYLSSSKGNIDYINREGKVVSRDDLYKYLTIVAPYMELDTELTPTELFKHLQNFKLFKCSTVIELMEIANLKGNKDKQIMNFSSGMNQRLELSLAMLSDAELVILDEPTSFLDEESKMWWANLLNTYTKDKTVIIASNDQFDLDQTDEVVYIKTIT